VVILKLTRSGRPAQSAHKVTFKLLPLNLNATNAMQASSWARRERRRHAMIAAQDTMQDKHRSCAPRAFQGSSQQHKQVLAKTASLAKRQQKFTGLMHARIAP
jgi:hypothetical protein